MHEGKLVAVLGGAGSLGFELAKSIAEAGATVVITSRDLSKAQNVAALYSGKGTLVPLAVNLADEASVAALVKELSVLGKPLVGVVKCAGGNDPKATINDDTELGTMPRAAMRALFDENLAGLVNAADMLGALMLKHGEPSSFVSIGSMAGMNPLTNVLAYDALMAAEHNFVRALAVQFGFKYQGQIRFNVVAPGFFPAEQNKRLLYAADGSLTPRGEKILRTTPFGRIGDAATDLVGAVKFLLSSESAFVNGTVLPVDGGFSAFCGV